MQILIFLAPISSLQASACFKHELIVNHNEIESETTPTLKCVRLPELLTFKKC